MIKDEHRTFIHKSLLDIMREVVCSSNHLGQGMEFTLVKDYLLQSLFLQMAGAQEQKMKCVCWELATDDLDYRYNRYYKSWNLHECSTLKDKSNVYMDILKQIKKADSSFNLFANPMEKENFRDEVLNKVCDVFTGTNIAKYYKTKFDSYIKTFSNIPPANITPNNSQIFAIVKSDFSFDTVDQDKEMFAIYTLLYKHRNKSAHNTASYQLNLPSLKELRNANYQKYDNIFLFFATLVMIDEIFIKLFDKYESLQ